MKNLLKDLKDLQEKIKVDYSKNKILEEIKNTEKKAKNNINIKFEEFNKLLKCNNCKKIITKNYYKFNNIILCKNCLKFLSSCKSCKFLLKNSKCFLKLKYKNKINDYIIYNKNFKICSLKLRKNIKFTFYTQNPKKQKIKSRYYLKNKLNSKYLK